MPQLAENRLHRMRPVLLAMGCVLLVFIALSSYTFWEERRLQALLLEQAAILHQQASQRADQHDAHLTALSAVAVKDGTGRKDLFLEVAAAIKGFYPRIRAIDLVSLSDATGVTTRPAADPETDDVIRDAVRASGGKLVLRPQASAAGTYLLVKRSPNTSAALYGLALEIDAGMLVKTESAFWDRPSARYSLWLDGDMLWGAPLEAAPQFDKVLGSVSQPLVLKAAISPRLDELLTPRAFIALSAATALLYAFMLLGLRQMARMRAAEQAARLHAQDARLAHALRVNALGEMASGMAHELAQPLSAILSQVQAGKRLAARGDFDRLGQILADSELQTRRAAAILDRLRHWTQPGEPVLGEISVNQAVENVEVLLRAEAARTGVEISHELAPGLPSVSGNAVELEQVIFNLVRNAMDAVSGAETKKVVILTEALDGSVRLSVSDTGPGIPETLRNRLFDPFVTGKPGGTGLGLTLCQRLVERMGGEITPADDAHMTRFHVVLPAAGKRSKDSE